MFSLAENLSKTDPWLKQTWHRSAARTPAAHQTRSRTDVPMLLCSTTSLFTPALNWCCVVNLLQLPDGERLICWVTQIYTVPMERLCSFNEFIYGNDARLQLEYGISGHSAVNNLPLHKHGPSKSKTLFNIQKPVSYIFIDVVWTCVIRLWCSTRLLVENDICEMSLWGMINSESLFWHSLLRFHGYIWKLLNQQLTESIWMKE